MDFANARAELGILLGAGILGLLSSADIDWCLDRARETDDYDPWTAAAEAADMLGRRAKRGVVVEWDSDGQRVKRGAADWESMAADFRAASPRNAGGQTPDFAFLIV
ncbi:MAG: hypothetical protein AAGC63_15385 [Propionicimonas sp.]